MYSPKNYRKPQPDKTSGRPNATDYGRAKQIRSISGQDAVCQQGAFPSSGSEIAASSAAGMGERLVGGARHRGSLPRPGWTLSSADVNKHAVAINWSIKQIRIV